MKYSFQMFTVQGRKVFAMCKTLFIVVFAAVVGTFFLPSVTSAEMLVNADFEGSTGWSFIRIGNVTGSYTTDYNHTTGGDQSVKLPGDDSGTAVNCQILQDVSIDSSMIGKQYTASLYAYVATNELSSASMIIGYLDSSDNWFAGSGWQTIDVVAGSWVQKTVSEIIPTGTAKLRFVFGADDATPYTYFDDASLTVVPEPCSLSLLVLGTLGLLAYAWRKRK